MSIPLDAAGNPKVLVSNAVEELIPTAQYANIKIGPAVVTKYVDDTPEDIALGLNECYNAAEACVAANRDALLELVRSAGLK